MAQVSFSQMVHAEQIGNTGASASGKNEGTLKADGKEHSVVVFSDSEAVTEGADQFLQESNRKKSSVDLLDYEFSHITNEDIEIENEIGELLKDLDKKESSEEGSQLSPTPKNHAESQRLLQKSNVSGWTKEGQNPKGETNTRSQVVHSSLFSLARTFHTTLTETRKRQEGEQKKEKQVEGPEKGKSSVQLPSSQKSESRSLPDNKYDREGKGKEGREGEKEREQKNKDEESPKNKKIIPIQRAANVATFSSDLASDQGQNSQKPPVPNIQANRSSPRVQASHTNNPVAQKQAGNGPLGGMESIYIRFMALMARILGQAELEAHELYTRIKERTDAIDVLTLLISKINSEKGAIDWSNNEEMKKLIDKARAIGVDIPEEKLKWTEDEKKLLKENIQMRKDSMEKMTQLERTDMQRYLQEASQCHQARSNVLKLLKEVIDTFIHNMRPS